MGKRFYIVIFCVLSCSVLLLGMSYSKNSNDSLNPNLIESSNDSFRVVYSADKNLDTRNNNELRVLSRNNLVFSDYVVNKILIPKNQPIWLKCEINHLSLDFLYSLDGKNFIKIVSNLDCSNLSDEAYSLIGHEGHTGTFVGMACQDLSGNHLYADFEYFEYHGEE